MSKDTSWHRDTHLIREGVNRTDNLETSEASVHDLWLCL